MTAATPSALTASTDHEVTVDGDRAGTVTEFHIPFSEFSFRAVTAHGIVLGRHRSLASAVFAVESVHRLLRMGRLPGADCRQVVTT